MRKGIHICPFKADHAPLMKLWSRWALNEIAIAMMILTWAANAAEPSPPEGSAPALSVSTITIPAAAFDDPVHQDVDIGAARANATVPFRVELDNKGGALTIGKPTSSCPCIVVKSTVNHIDSNGRATIDFEWYVGPEHGDRSLLITIPLKDDKGRSSGITLPARAEVTDLVNMDYHGRILDVGEIDVNLPTQDASAILEFEKTTFREWDAIAVHRGACPFSVDVSELAPGHFTLKAASVRVADLRQVVLGAYSDDITLGFSNRGVPLPEEIHYRLSAKFHDTRYQLTPDQVFVGSQSRAIRPKGDLGSARIHGFKPISVTHELTAYEYNGIFKNADTSPFAITFTEPASPAGDHAITVVAADQVIFDRSTMRRCDRACSHFLIKGTAPNGDVIVYNFLVFFTVEP